MESNGVRLRTYRQVWRLEHIIYQIERVRLPFPVTFRQVGIAVATLLVMTVLGHLPGIRLLPALVTYAVIPVLAAWYLTSQTLDGKPPHRWLLSMAIHIMSNKRFNRFHSLSKGRRVRFTRHRR